MKGTLVVLVVTLWTCTPTQVSVVDIIDGDTIRARSGDQTEDVRLIGINSPERNECMGDGAADLLERLVAGRNIRLVVDRSERDVYGRLLRLVFQGSVLVNERLVRAGLALATPVGPDRSAELLLAQAELVAEEAGVGLWAKDACGPASAASIEIVAISSGEGTPGDPTAAELIVLGNGSSEAVDLKGWSVRDATSSHRYMFGPYLLESLGRVMLTTGCGRDREGLLHWCSDTPVWNDAGDHALLLDPHGNIVSHLRY